LLINRDTWYAHWNRGKAPYALSRKQRDKSVDYSIDYWMNDKWPLQKYSFWWLIDKFNPPGWEGTGHLTKGLSARKQLVLHKGYERNKYREPHQDYLGSELWKRRLGIAEPGKLWRIKLFYETFEEIAAEFKKGKEYTDDEIRKTAYYHYLSTHLSKKVLPQNLPKYLEKWDYYLLKKFRGSERLFKDIRDNGLRTPLEFYREGKNILLWRGSRRLVILHVLGQKEVPIVVHKDVGCKELEDRFSFRKPAEKSIDTIAQEHFVKHGGKATDKYWVHRYTPIYDRVFGDIRNQRIKLLEVGIARGASLLLWHQCFPKAQLFGVDKNPDIWKEMAGGLDRLQMFIGKQQDVKFLKREVIPSGPYDIIIDDAGHTPEHQMATWAQLWNSVKPFGWYVVEDCYVSYKDLDSGRPVVPREMTELVDSIYEDQKIASVQFYYNLCLIQRGM